MGFGDRRADSEKPAPMPVEARDLALGLLALRPHLRGEVARKLARKGIDAAIIEGVLEQLAAQGLLDDVAFAARFAEETSARRGWGAARVAAELRRRGGGDDAVAAAREALPDDAVAATREAAERWRRRNPRLDDDPATRARLARYLARLGHPSGAIWTVVGEADPGA